MLFWASEEVFGSGEAVSLGGINNPPANERFGFKALVRKKTTHSSILAWRIPWTEEPGGLEPIGLQGVGRD